MAKDNILQYKFRDLKVFGSTEWLANNQKKYRSVFDEIESSFVYCELSFFNKLFDEEDWNVKIDLKCFDAEGKELCSLNADSEVKREENIVFVREGWGVKSLGSYWKRGTYRWEAWINGEFIAEKTFYIENGGIVTPTVNPYFDLKAIRFYEGPDSNLPRKERKYLQTFNKKNTRYIWVELTANNLIEEHSFWACELFFNFKTHSGQLKGSIDKLMFVYPNGDDIVCTVGWGSEREGTWGEDRYTVDVVFMDQMIGSASFEVSDREEPWREEPTQPITPILPSAEVKPEKVTAPKETESLDEAMKVLDDLIGLSSIKQKIREYTSYLNFITLRQEKGFEDTDKINLHAVFTGNPGTGKTTVANMLGKIYKQLGLLSKGHVLEVDRADLVAEFIGQTAPKTKEAIKKAQGGILFIDEAYALARKNDDSKDFGKEAIEILLKEMSDGKGDLAIIVAGYPSEMETFMDSNPGLKSRFNMHYEFPDYTPQELMEIGKYASNKRGVEFDDTAKDTLYKRLVEAYRGRDDSFGNARFVNKLIEKSKINMGLRLMSDADPHKLTKKQLSTITEADIEKIFSSEAKSLADIPIDEDLLKSAQRALNALIGLDNVKKEIDELVKLVRFYREIGKDVRQSFSLHTVFTGNPGTGKTTVARILAQIYRALGILERGSLVECDRQKLVGSHVGQTAIKTAEVIDQAMGGVLFIDEAYALSEGGENDFGKEAIETILKRMEDHRGNFIVIAAGYTDNMTRFLESNPGLKSRFDRVMHFEDYTSDELMEIAHKMLSDNNIKPDKASQEHLKEYLDFLFDTRDKYFGNARSVRKVVEKSIKNQHLRLAKLDPEKRTPAMVKKITLEDVKEFQVDPEKRKGGSGIGFNVNS